eukprot:1640430-Prymnesium_polylepis.1
MPSHPKGAAAHDAFIERRRQLPPMSNTDGWCSLELDDDEKSHLWVQDHDGNASTALKCTDDSPQREASYDAFGYDAVFAIAHALHHLIELEESGEIVGHELLETLINQVHFEGVTGMVAFHDASDDPNRQSHGDRRTGVTCVLLNYKDNTQGLTQVGSWTPCTTSSCSWFQRWTPAIGEVLTFSTADNHQPQQAAICSYGEVLTHEGR